MQELSFRVQASNDTPHYTVTIQKDEHHLTAHCSCENGGANALCKHRLSILAGKAKWVISDNVPDVKRVLSWVAWTDLGEAILKATHAQKRLKEAEKELEKATAQCKAAEEDASATRDALIHAMND